MIGNVSYLEIIKLVYNELTVFISESICDLDIVFYWLNPLFGDNFAFTRISQNSAGFGTFSSYLNAIFTAPFDEQ